MTGSSSTSAHKLNYCFLCRLSRLTTHAIIPENEIWVKIGGDKGGGSMKLNFQIANCLNPNSVTNTCVFAAFEATDSVNNLHVAFDRYRDQMIDLQKLVWRYTLTHITMRS